MKSALLRALWVLAAVCVPASAVTTIQETVVCADGSPATGRLDIEWTLFKTTTGIAIPAGKKRVVVTAGVMNPDAVKDPAGTILLEPMDTASNNPWYTVGASLCGNRKTEYWIVPTSATPVTRSFVIWENPRQVTFLRTMQDAAGALNGYHLIWRTATGRWMPEAFTTLTDPMTTDGDMIYRAAGLATRLPVGLEGRCMTVTGGIPSWQPCPATGIGSFNSLTAATQTMDSVNDANVTLSISQSSTSNHRYTMGWNGQLALSRLPFGTTNQLLKTNITGTAVEQATLSTGTTGADFAVAFGAGTVTLNLPVATGSNPGKLSAADHGLFSGKAGTGTCPANEVSIQTTTGGVVCVALTDAYIPDTITLTNLTQVTNRAISDTTGDLVATRVDDGGAAATQFLAAGAAGAAGFRAISDADVPNDITVDLATTATTALAGDSATGFFPAGELEIARGGTNQNGATLVSGNCVQFDGTRFVTAAAPCGTGGASGQGIQPYTTTFTNQTQIDVAKTVHQQGNYPTGFIYTTDPEDTNYATTNTCKFAAALGTGGTTLGDARVKCNPAQTGRLVILSGGTSIIYWTDVSGAGPFTITEPTHGQGSHGKVWCERPVTGNEFEEMACGKNVDHVTGTAVISVSPSQSFRIYISSTFAGPTGIGGGFGDPGANGFMDRTALNTSVARTLIGTANEISVTNGGGGGNPVFSLVASIDLGSKSVELPNSTTLPATCTVGQGYMDTDATSGRRWYLCESTNTWVLQGDGGAGGGITMLSEAGDFQGTLESANDILRIGANCSLTTPCITGTPDNPTRFTASATLNASGTGTGACRIELTYTVSPPVLHAICESGVTAVCSGMGCTATPTVGAAFIAPSKPLYIWTMTSGVWDTAGATDLRNVYGYATFAKAGFGLGSTDSGGERTFFTDTAIIPTYGLTTVTFSTTPTLAATTTFHSFTITLTDNVSSSTLTGAQTAGEVKIKICQDGTGSRQWTWPTNIKGGMNLGASQPANTCASQIFGLFDGTNLYALSSGVTGM